MDTIKIFVVTHGPKLSKGIVLDFNRFVVLGGAEFNTTEEKISYLDNDGENISTLNRYYSELTVLYWIWKNDKSTIVGLEHYRRFFIQKNFNLFKFKTLNSRKIKKYLNDYDFIVPKPIKMSKSLYDSYDNSHFISDLDMALNYLSKDSAEHDSIIHFFKNTYLFYPANMFISSRLRFEKYVSWLFDTFENSGLSNLDLDHRDNYQSRMYGFLSERLFTYYLLNKDLNIKEISIVTFKDDRSVLLKKTIVLIPYSLRKLIAKIRGRIN